MIVEVKVPQLSESVASASPAGGYVARHNERQKTLVEQAFSKLK